MDGEQLAQDLRAQESEKWRRPLPMVACTVSVSPSQIGAYLNGDCDHHLAKPVSMEALEETISWARGLRARQQVTPAR